MLLEWDKSYDAILDFLAKWLVDHIVIMDRKYLGNNGEKQVQEVL